MSSTRSAIIADAERVFDRHGFAASGMDRLTETANVSSRTLYKHLGSKNGLITAVLEARCERFFATFQVNTIDALFGALGSWTEAEGARGCLFLRAEGEDLGQNGEVTSAVTAYRTRLRDLIRDIVTTETGEDDDFLTEQILILFEGATSAASYRGQKAILAARSAAAVLIAGFRGKGTTTEHHNDQSWSY